MAKEMVVWCDVCLKEDNVHTKSSTIVIQVRPVMKEPLGLDLCDKHEINLVHPLMEMLSKYGEKEGATANAIAAASNRRSPAMPDTRTYPCLLCPEVSHSNHSFVQHIARAHGTNPTNLYGTTCPVDGQSFGGSHSMGAHLSRTHPDYGQTTAESFKKVQAEGDPHGVVADRLAKFPVDPRTVVQTRASTGKKK